MLPLEQNIIVSKKFRHPLIMTCIGIVIGLFLISILCYGIYQSNNHVSDCKRPQIYPLYYLNGSVDRSTMVSMCRTTDYVQLQWSIEDSHIVSKYQNCHDPLYKTDSVGIILQSPLYRYVNNYYTFIINPDGVVYSEDISPYYDTHSHVFQCDQIKAKVNKLQKGWQASLKIPIDKIGNGYIMSTQIVNFFRVNIDHSGRKIVSFNDKNNIHNIKNYIVQQE